jgi:hypothetical protein
MATHAEPRDRRRPPDRLNGSTVALLAIGKDVGAEFIEGFEKFLLAQGIGCERYSKEIPTQLASAALLDRMAARHKVAVLALGDCGSSVSAAAHDLLHLDERGVAGVALIHSHYADVFKVQCDVMQFRGASIAVSAVEPRPFAEALFVRTLAAISAPQPQASPPPDVSATK